MPLAEQFRSLIIEPGYRWTVTIPLATCLLLYVYGTWPHSVWSKLGVPGPKPSPFVGNIKQLGRMGWIDTFKQWVKEYGKNVGVYFFREPVLLTTDVEVIKEVFLRNFDKFPARGLIHPLTQYPVKGSVAFVEGDTWKRQRATISPAFSAHKIKMMTEHITKCCEQLTEAMKDIVEKGEPVDITRLFNAYALDWIAGVGYGMEIHSLKEQDNDFLNTMRKMLQSKDTTRAYAVASIFPFLAPLLVSLGFRRSNKRDVEYVLKTIRGFVEQRKANPEDRMDLLQQLVLSEATEEEIRKDPQAKQLTPREVVANAFIMFNAGNETNSLSLQYTAYLLALNPHKQEELYREIRNTLGQEKPDYDKVHSMRYLENCIWEALRLLPPAIFVPRQCRETCVVNGLTIPSGAHVVVPPHVFNKDEDLFPDPEDFIPERYEDVDHPVPTVVKELAFGAGPRQCMGMRLSLFNIKMLLVAIFSKFRLFAVDETTQPIVFGAYGFALTPDKPIILGAELRQQEANDLGDLNSDEPEPEL